MLATLTADRFSDDGWIFERKLDGVRAVAIRAGSSVRLFSRNHKDMAGSYPEIVAALRDQPMERFAVDGEIVAFDGKQTSFSVLQQRIHRPGGEADQPPVFFYVFDITSLDGQAVTSFPLRDRKRLLREALSYDDPIRFSTHRNGAGEAYFAEACRKGWEGVVAKRAASTYAGGKRTPDWLKFKCVRGQEFVICGFTDPQRSRIGFGALIVGYYDGAALRYAGRVGTGYDARTLRELRARLETLRVSEPPVAGPTPERHVHWVRPELVAEVDFAEWTHDGRLRHSRFLGLRTDKAAREVVREG